METDNLWCPVQPPTLIRDRWSQLFALNLGAREFSDDRHMSDEMGALAGVVTSLILIAKQSWAGNDGCADDMWVIGSFTHRHIRERNDGT
jgi:hypothetical protein